MWVQTKNEGWVNLAFVANVRRLRDGGFSLIGPDGRGMGIVSEHVTLDEHLDTEIIPASAGQEAYVIWTWIEDGEAKGRAVRAAVVAWRICSLAAIPIVAGEAPLMEESTLILHPDGRVAEPFNAEWQDIDAALAEFIEQERKREAEKSAKSTPP